MPTRHDEKRGISKGGSDNVGDSQVVDLDENSPSSLSPIKPPNNSLSNLNVGDSAKILRNGRVSQSDYVVEVDSLSKFLREIRTPRVIGIKQCSKGVLFEDMAVNPHIVIENDDRALQGVGVSTETESTSLFYYLYSVSKEYRCSFRSSLESITNESPPLSDAIEDLDDSGGFSSLDMCSVCITSASVVSAQVVYSPVGGWLHLDLDVSSLRENVKQRIGFVTDQLCSSLERGLRALNSFLNLRFPHSNRPNHVTLSLFITNSSFPSFILRNTLREEVKNIYSMRDRSEDILADTDNVKKSKAFELIPVKPTSSHYTESLSKLMKAYSVEEKDNTDFKDFITSLTSLLPWLIIPPSRDRVHGAVISSAGFVQDAATEKRKGWGKRDVLFRHLPLSLQRITFDLSNKIRQPRFSTAAETSSSNEVEDRDSEERVEVVNLIGTTANSAEPGRSISTVLDNLPGASRLERRSKETLKRRPSDNYEERDTQVSKFNFELKDGSTSKKKRYESPTGIRSSSQIVSLLGSADKHFSDSREHSQPNLFSSPMRRNVPVNGGSDAIPVFQYLTGLQWGTSVSNRIVEYLSQLENWANNPSECPFNYEITPVPVTPASVINTNASITTSKRSDRNTGSAWYSSEGTTSDQLLPFVNGNITQVSRSYGSNPMKSPISSSKPLLLLPAPSTKATNLLSIISSSSEGGSAHALDADGNFPVSSSRGLLKSLPYFSINSTLKEVSPSSNAHADRRTQVSVSEDGVGPNLEKSKGPTRVVSLSSSDSNSQRATSVVSVDSTSRNTRSRRGAKESVPLVFEYSKDPVLFRYPNFPFSSMIFSDSMERKATPAPSTLGPPNIDATDKGVGVNITAPFSSLTEAASPLDQDGVVISPLSSTELMDLETPDEDDLAELEMSFKPRTNGFEKNGVSMKDIRKIIVSDPESTPSVSSRSSDITPVENINATLSQNMGTLASSAEDDDSVDSTIVESSRIHSATTISASSDFDRPHRLVPQNAEERSAANNMNKRGFSLEPTTKNEESDVESEVEVVEVVPASRCDSGSGSKGAHGSQGNIRTSSSGSYAGESVNGKANPILETFVRRLRSIAQPSADVAAAYLPFQFRSEAVLNIDEMYVGVIEEDEFDPIFSALSGLLGVPYDTPRVWNSAGTVDSKGSDSSISHRPTRPACVSIHENDLKSLVPPAYMNDRTLDFLAKFIMIRRPVSPFIRRKVLLLPSSFYGLMQVSSSKSSGLRGIPVKQSTLIHSLSQLNRVCKERTLDAGFADALHAYATAYKWTRSSRLLLREYVLMPVNFSSHWSLVVGVNICVVSTALCILRDVLLGKIGLFLLEDKEDASSDYSSAIHSSNIPGTNSTVGSNIGSRNVQRSAGSFTYRSSTGRQLGSNDSTNNSTEVRSISNIKGKQGSSSGASTTPRYYLKYFYERSEGDVKEVDIKKSSLKGSFSSGSRPSNAPSDQTTAVFNTLSATSLAPLFRTVIEEAKRRHQLRDPSSIDKRNSNHSRAASSVAVPSANLTKNDDSIHILDNNASLDVGTNPPSKNSSHPAEIFSGEKQPMLLHLDSAQFQSTKLATNPLRMYLYCEWVALCNKGVHLAPSLDNFSLNGTAGSPSGWFLPSVEGKVSEYEDIEEKTEDMKRSSFVTSSDPNYVVKISMRDLMDFLNMLIPSERIDTSEQENSFDCGAFTMMYASNIIARLGTADDLGLHHVKSGSKRTLLVEKGFSQSDATKYRAFTRNLVNHFQSDTSVLNLLSLPTYINEESTEKEQFIYDSSLH